jgi:hypothetical protein
MFINLSVLSNCSVSWEIIIITFDDTSIEHLKNEEADNRSNIFFSLAYVVSTTATYLQPVSLQ